MKRKILTILFITICAFSTALAQKGKCGDNATWTFDKSTKTLTIQGCGAVIGWSYSMNVLKSFDQCPWKKYIKKIEKVVVSPGITRIGVRSFRDCSNLISVTLPETLIGIEAEAFKNCISLSRIELPNSLSSIGCHAFENCEILSDIVMPDIAIEISPYDFFGYYDSSYIPFKNCRNITKVQGHNYNLPNYIYNEIYAYKPKYFEKDCRWITIQKNAPKVKSQSQIETKPQKPKKEVTKAPVSSNKHLSYPNSTLKEITFTNRTQNYIASQIYKVANSAVFTIVIKDDQGGYTQGSGFFISSNGLCLSNFHVLK